MIFSMDRVNIPGLVFLGMSIIEHLLLEGLKMGR